MTKAARARGTDPAAILRHWREAVPKDRLAHLVKDASRVLNRALQERLAEQEVSFGHWTFLRILWEHDGLTQRELSGEAGVMEPTTHAALNAMEARGLIERRRQAGDKRNQHIFVTAAGKKLKAKLVPYAIEVNRLAVRGMPAADISTARRVLLGIIENLAALPASASTPATASTTTSTATSTAAPPSTPPRKISMSEWIQVAARADVPDDGTYPASLNGEPVCLYNVDGEIFATHDICTHGNANLSEGFVVNGHIECPFHQGMFDIRTGEASAAPCTVALKTYPVKVENDVVWLKAV